MFMLLFEIKNARMSDHELARFVEDWFSFGSENPDQSTLDTLKQLASVFPYHGKAYHIAIFNEVPKTEQAIKDALNDRFSKKQLISWTKNPNFHTSDAMYTQRFEKTEGVLISSNNVTGVDILKMASQVKDKISGEMFAELKAEAEVVGPPQQFEVEQIIQL